MFQHPRTRHGVVEILGRSIITVYLQASFVVWRGSSMVV